MNNSKELRIIDVCKQVYSGGTPNRKHEEYYKNGTIPWLNTGEIVFNRITKTENYITEDGYAKSSAKWVPENSVIVAMYGASAARVAINKIRLTTNQACCNLVINPDIADYRYVYYYLCTQFEKLSSLANGGAQQNLNAGQIKEYPITVPELKIQRAIADTLSLIDDKIELNNKINDNLSTYTFNESKSTSPAINFGKRVSRKCANLMFSDSFAPIFIKSGVTKSLYCFTSLISNSQIGSAPMFCG